MFRSILHILLALFLSPLLMSVVNRTKAFFGGRRGQRWLQPYHDIWKLLRKGAVISRTCSWVFRAGPVVSLAALLGALALAPFGGAPAALAFEGDLIFFITLMGLLRFFMAAAALDTGSAFEGMGAAREMHFSVLLEVGLMLGLIAIAVLTGSASLSGMAEALPGAAAGRPCVHVLLLVAVTLLVVLLVENARIPIDDPATHLELTMIHEVMILDHGGVDLGLLHYASCLKLWLFGALALALTQPVRFGSAWADTLASLGFLALIGVLVGIIESIMARLRMHRVPQLIVAACVFPVVALLILTR